MGETLGIIQTRGLSIYLLCGVELISVHFLIFLFDFYYDHLLFSSFDKMCLLFCFPAIQKETRLSLLSQITTVILKKEFGILCLFSGPLTDAMKKLNSSLICFLREK